MELLTGHAKKQFEKHLTSGVLEHAIESRISNFYSLPRHEKQAAYVDFFDNWYLYIQVEPYIGGGACVFYPKVIYRRNDNFVDMVKDTEEYFEHRADATDAAIIMAKEIYNETHKD